jgi:hypothetical protein
VTMCGQNVASKGVNGAKSINNEGRRNSPAFRAESVCLSEESSGLPSVGVRRPAFSGSISIPLDKSHSFDIYLSER